MAPTLVHVNAAKQNAVRMWQYRVKDSISRLKKQGFTPVAVDEAFFIHDTVSGRKYRGPTGERIYRTYTGSHKRIAMFGGVSDDGRQLFRTYNGFNTKLFLRFVREIHRKFGKVLILVDRATPHRSRALKEYLKENPDVKIRYFPTGSPFLNPIEHCWQKGKRILLVSEYYETLEDMVHAVSEYYRTARFKIEMMNYLLGRSAL